MCRLQSADKVPLDGRRQERGLAGEFLGVVLAKVGVRRVASCFCPRGLGLVQGEDVICGLELRDCYETNLEEYVSQSDINFSWNLFEFDV